VPAWLPALLAVAIGASDPERVALLGEDTGASLAAAVWEGHPEWAHYKTKLVEWLSAQLGAKP